MDQSWAFLASSCLAHTANPKSLTVTLNPKPKTLSTAMVSSERGGLPRRSSLSASTASSPSPKGQGWALLAHVTMGPTAPRLPPPEPPWLTCDRGDPGGLPRRFSLSASTASSPSPMGQGWALFASSRLCTVDSVLLRSQPQLAVVG